MSIKQFKAAEKYLREKKLKEERRKRSRLKQLPENVNISIDTLDIMQENYNRLVYTHKKATSVVIGYDILQYLSVIRKFIQRKYDISLQDLEILLFLYPIGLWSKKDYDLFPHGYTTRRVQYILEKGYAENIFEDQDVPNKTPVYRLTPKGQTIVTRFYKYLNKEETIPETPNYNPYFKARATRYEMKTAKLIAELNQKILGRTEKSEAHKKVDERIHKYHKKRKKQQKHNKVNALKIKLQKQREERAREKEEKEAKLKELQDKLNSYVPE